MRLLLTAVVLSLFACEVPDPDPMDSEDAGTPARMDAGTVIDPDPICRVTVSGAVTATFDCPKTSSSTVTGTMLRAKTANPTTNFSLVTGNTSNGTSINVSISFPPVPMNGTVVTQADASAVGITIIKTVGGTTERQWAGFKNFASRPDQGSFTLTLNSIRQDADTSVATTWSANGTLSATLPVLPDYMGTDSVTVAVTFRPKT